MIQWLQCRLLSCSVQTKQNKLTYNIEMTEVTGGTFWKTYTPGQIAGTEEFRGSGALDDFTSMDDLMQYYDDMEIMLPFEAQREIPADR